MSCFGIGISPVGCRGELVDHGGLHLGVVLRESALEHPQAVEVHVVRAQHHGEVFAKYNHLHLRPDDPSVNTNSVFNTV